MRAPYKFTTGDNMTGQCSACMEVFYGEEAFDRHRKGEEPDRVCLDPATRPPTEEGRAFWLDNQERWHFSAPVDPDEYEARRIASGRRLQAARQDHEGRAGSAEHPLSGVPGAPADSEPSDTGGDGS